MTDTRTLLFLCPHAAAKSVLAKAEFARLAAAKGLVFGADAAGTGRVDGSGVSIAHVARVLRGTQRAPRSQRKSFSAWSAVSAVPGRDRACADAVSIGTRPDESAAPGRPAPAG